MVKFLRRLFLGEPACDHTYVIEEERNVFEVNYLGGFYDHPSYKKYVLRCSKCGWVTVRRS